MRISSSGIFTDYRSAHYTQHILHLRLQIQNALNASSNLPIPKYTIILTLCLSTIPNDINKNQPK